VGALHPRALAIVDMEIARHEASRSCRFSNEVVTQFSALIGIA